MPEAHTALTRLRLVRDIQENESAATVRFHEGGHAELPRRDPAYASHLRLARRSHERQHPVGVTMGAGDVIAQLVRADNDIPLEIADTGGGATRVLFQGHDGVFQLRNDHPDAGRIGALLAEAIRARSPVWFLADKRDLTLVDAVLVS